MIREYMESLELSSGCDPAKEVEARLNSLRGVDATKQSTGMAEPDSDDEETATKKLIEKALAEAALEAKYEAEELEGPPEDMEVEVNLSASTAAYPLLLLCLLARWKICVMYKNRLFRRRLDPGALTRSTSAAFATR